MNFHLDRAIEILERTPAVFRAQLEGLPDDWTSPNEGPDTFSARDNLAHLIHAERTNWIPRARAIRSSGGDGRLPEFDRFGHATTLAGWNVRDLLDEFERLRMENLRTLRDWDLGEEELDREGTHPALGVVTLRKLIATWVVHDFGHIAQTARVLAKQYRDAVGPWRQYLPILDR